MCNGRQKIFLGRHFADEAILSCVRWYLRYSLSYRDVEELMAERGLGMDHSSTARWPAEH
jgi:transposase-like protein